jgi:hypothetical protein
MLSSLSPSARTWPHSANEVEVDSILPSASTSAMEIWTDAWSLAMISRSCRRKKKNENKSKNQRGSFQRFPHGGNSISLRTCRRAFARNIKVDENTLGEESNLLRKKNGRCTEACLLTWSFSILKLRETNTFRKQISENCCTVLPFGNWWQWCEQGSDSGF